MFQPALAQEVQKPAETEKAEETSVSIKDVTVSGTTHEILIKETETAEKDNKLYVSVYKHKDNIALDDGKGNVCYLKEQKRAEYDYDAKGEKQVVVDLSSLSVTTNWFIAVKGDVNSKPLVFQLGVRATRLAASIDYTEPDDPKLVLTNLTNASNKTNFTNIEFSTDNGIWHRYHKKTIIDVQNPENNVEKTDLTIFQKFGATLKVRAIAFDGSIATFASLDVTLDKVNRLKCYPISAGCATNAVKVKIAKLATGPRVSVNYAKNTISIPKTAEYRTKVGEEFENKLVKASTKKTVVVPIAAFKLSDAATIDVRIAAKVNTKDVTKSKSASHITEVAIPKIEELSVKLAANGEEEAADIDKDNFKTADLEKITANGKVTFKYGTKSGIATLTSADTDSVYEVYVTRESTVGVVSDKIVTPASTVKGVKKLTAAKALKLTKLKDGDKIFIRKAGNAKNKVFASEFAAFGTVKFPTATATPMLTALASTGA